MSRGDPAARRFLCLDGGLDLELARALVRDVAPELVVVRVGARPDLVVLAAAALDRTDDAGGGSPARAAPDATTLAEHALAHGVPALLAGPGAGRYRVAAAADPGTAPGGGTTTPTVVLDDDGIVAAVLPGGLLDAAVEEPDEAPDGGLLGGPDGGLLGGPDGADVDVDAVLRGRQDWWESFGVEMEVGAGAEAAGEMLGGAGPAEPMALRVTLPGTVRLGATVPLLVELEPGAGGPGSAPVSVRADEVLEIMASPRSGFTLTSPTATRPMTVVGGGQTLPVKFSLRADVEGTGLVKVYAFRDEICVASLTVSARIAADDVVPVEVTPSTLVVPEPVAVPVVADLRLVVLQESYRGGVALRYRLTTRDGGVVSDFGPHALDTDPSGYVHARFAEIQQLAEQPGGWGAPERTRLERIGADLYEALVPAGLQEVLWGSERVRSLLVETEEPWIPWELCRMTSRRDGAFVSRGYLCDVYEMSRWLPGTTPRSDLRASRIAVVAPRDSGLPSSPSEVAMLEGLAASGPVVDRIKATYTAVLATLESHRYDVLHFVGHGRNTVPADATQSEFSLSGRWRLRPSDISGETRNLGLATPLVFMNACQVAQASMALHGIGGWAAAMTRAGAGAFIGTHWDVRDDLALEFATAFYERLPTTTVAAAVRAARGVVRDRSDGDPTWLAYTVHAAPDARCELGAPAT